MNTAVTAPSLTHINAVNHAFDLIPDYVVDRYARDFNLPMRVAYAHAYELVRYVAMCSDFPKAQYGMFGQVDEFWHVFILHTRDYAEWCDKVVGRFFHHTPTLPSEKQEVRDGEREDTYAKFYEDYSKFYGMAPRAIWPKPHDPNCPCRQQTQSR